MRSSNLLPFLFLSGMAFAAHFDPPDLTLEGDLHRQYIMRQQLGDIPMTAGRGVESYKIQTGESLWNLSEMLYGDGQFWPRVWAQNKSITNPHLIRPGYTLQFLMGSEDNMPAFRVSEAEEGGGLELASAQGQNPLIEIPPPEIPPKPILKVPRSFPEWQQVFKKTEDVGGLDDTALGRVRALPTPKIFLTAFVQETELDPVGYFLETDLESALPMANQYVYVKVKKGAGQPGAKMLVVHDAGKIKKINKRVDYDAEAYLMQVAGEIQLNEMVQAEFSKSSDRDSYDFYRALVTRATGLSGKNFALIPGELQIVDLTDAGPSGTAVAQIIGAEKHEASTLYGPGELVFLNRGTSSGLEVGQLLDIYEDRVSRKDTPVHFSPAASGRLKVVQVTPHLATAVILSARDGILQGDRVQQLSDNSGAREDLSYDSGMSSAPSENFDSDPGAVSAPGDSGADDIEKELENGDF
jgi:hypothetical protein